MWGREIEHENLEVLLGRGTLGHGQPEEPGSDNDQISHAPQATAGHHSSWSPTQPAARSTHRPARSRHRTRDEVM